MRFVVTGGAGFFGSVLLQHLDQAGHEVLSVDCLADTSLNARYYTAQVDITDREALKQAIRTFGRVDGIFHLAAVLAHDRRQFRRLWSTNVDGTYNVMEIARELSIPKVVFTSSNCVFATHFDKHVDELVSPTPVEEYGKSKLAAEEVVISYDATVSGVIIRCPTIISAGRLGLLTILFDFVREGRRLYVLGSGDNRYSFIYARDLAEACLLAMTSSCTGIYHIGSDSVPTIRQLYGGLAAFAEKPAKIVSVPAGPAMLALKALYMLGLSPLGPYHYRMLAANFVFDTRKAKKDLGWAPTKTNLEMLCEAYSYYVEHRDDIRHQMGLSPHRSPARAGIINLLRMIS